MHISDANPMAKHIFIVEALIDGSLKKASIRVKGCMDEETIKKIALSIFENAVFEADKNNLYVTIDKDKQIYRCKG